MEITTMGRVTVEARISNFQDAYQANKGLLPQEKVRAVQVPMPWWTPAPCCFRCPLGSIRELGLTRQRTRTARTAAGRVFI